MTEMFTKPETIVFLIPIVAIICGAAIKIARMKFDHDEKLAKIDAGMDPDENI